MRNVSGGEICFANNGQVWFEHYPAGHKLRSVVPTTFFAKKKQKVMLIGLETRFKRPFNRFPKTRKVFGVSKSHVLLLYQ